MTTSELDLQALEQLICLQKKKKELADRLEEMALARDANYRAFSELKNDLLPRLALAALEIEDLVVGKSVIYRCGEKLELIEILAWGDYEEYVVVTSTENECYCIHYLYRILGQLTAPTTSITHPSIDPLLDDPFSEE